MFIVLKFSKKVYFSLFCVAGEGNDSQCIVCRGQFCNICMPLLGLLLLYFAKASLYTNVFVLHGNLPSKCVKRDCGG